MRSICASLFHQFDESFEMMLTSCGLGAASVVRDQPPATADGSDSWPKPLVIFGRSDESFHHLGSDEVAVELIQFI